MRLVADDDDATTKSADLCVHDKKNNATDGDIGGIMAKVFIK